MKKILIKQATVINDGESILCDVLISGERIQRIDRDISDPHATIILGDGLYLLPGVIDDQVHFREPGLTHKGTIYSESRAAVAGGTTSFMDMPNTFPNTLSLELLEEKYQLACRSSLANFSFFMGINQHNLEEALKVNSEMVCGVTDDGLYFNESDCILANYPDFLESLFSRMHTLIALHSEDLSIIDNNLSTYKHQFGERIPFELHPYIRSEEACYVATKRIVEIAKKYNNRLHVLHISTDVETALFDNTLPINKKRITAEACVHHLWFSEEDYKALGSKIKWNPAVKKKSDKEGLLHALIDDRLDFIATDHAPHTLNEKMNPYFQASSGGPLVQHALPAMLESFHQGKIQLTTLVEKMSHHVAEAYRIIDRGYIREGYYADLVLVDLSNSWTVSKDNLLYKCGWSPFENQVFRSKIIKTIVNGNIVYANGIFDESSRGKRLMFSKDR